VHTQNKKIICCSVKEQSGSSTYNFFFIKVDLRHDPRVEKNLFCFINQHLWNPGAAHHGQAQLSAIATRVPETTHCTNLTKC
jgi:hypothetical protein